MSAAGVYTRSAPMVRLILCLLISASAVAQTDDVLQLYRSLRSNGLDHARVFRIRDASLDIEDLHITLNDGVLALMEPVAGHTTGAFFAGDGEVLVFPPNQAERESLALHTGAAVLEERFTTAFFRFSDDFSAQLSFSTRGPTDDAQEFVDKWDPAVRSLAAVDGLSVLGMLTRTTPPESRPQRFFHARLAGSRLGTFDVFLDTDYEEQVFLAQPNTVEGNFYYDIWAAFPMRSARFLRSASETSEQPASELGRRDIAIRRYDIDARIEPPHQLEGNADLDVDVLEGGDRVLAFQLSRFLKVSSVTAGDTVLASIQNEALQGGELARRGNDLVTVVFPEPLRAGQKLKLRFRYAGPVMTEAGGGLMYVGARGIWYPNRGVAMAEYDMTFTYPKDWTLLATGQKVSEQDSGGDKQAHWISEHPMPLAGFNLGEYVETSAHAGPTLVESFAGKGQGGEFSLKTAGPTSPPVFRGNRRKQEQGQDAVPIIERPPVISAHAPLVARDAARAIDFLSAHIGPFPYRTLALAQMPGRESLGWPGLIFLSSYAYLSPEERRTLSVGPVEELLYDGIVTTHEVAHQWWGDSVMRNGYRDDWLVEAISNYYAVLMMQKQRPNDVRLLMDNYRERLLSKAATGRALRDAGPVTLGTRLFSSRVPGAYETVLYGRGTWLFEMLHDLLREDSCRSADLGCPADARFFEVMRKLYQSHLGGTFSTLDVQKAFEEALPRSSWFEGRRSLQWFFDGWVNGTAIPRLALQSVRFSSKTGKTMATGKVMQSEAPDTLVTAVPLYAVAGPGKFVFVGRVFADGAETSFHLPVPAGTRELVLDPYHTLLSLVGN